MGEGGISLDDAIAALEPHPTFTAVVEAGSISWGQALMLAKKWLQHRPALTLPA